MQLTNLEIKTARHALHYYHLTYISPNKTIQFEYWVLANSLQTINYF